jgi:hypothetical protein
VDLMNTTGLYSLANRKAPRPDTCIHSGAVGGRLPQGPASFLKFTTSVAHYIVDDDGDHVLMRMTIQGTWSSASQNQDDRELASGLTELTSRLPTPIGPR